MRAGPYGRCLAGAAILGLGLGAAACHPKKLSDAVSAGAHISTSDFMKTPVAISDRLDCPQEEGELKLSSAAPDGKSCAYASDTGVVDLTLVQGSDEAAAVAPYRAQVNAAMPRQANGASATVSVSTETSADGRDVDKVDMPFLHVSDDGRRAHVKIFGMSIDADSHHSSHRDNVVVAEDDDDAGTPIGSGPRGHESIYLLAGDPATPQGYHAVGYIARSDGKGKTVVALFKSRNGDKDNHDHDLDALLDLNARKG